MNVLSRFKKYAQRDLPEVAGGIIEVGTERVLEAHGLSNIEAKQLAIVAATAVRDAIAAGQSALEDRQTATVIVRVASPPDLAITPCHFVYALPVRQRHVQDEVAAVAPRLWLSSQAAWIYAERASQDDMGLKGQPTLVLADDPVVDGNNQVDRIAWERFRHEHKVNGRRIAGDVPFGTYVLGEMPQCGVIAWKPMLTPHGMRIGTLGGEVDCALQSPPLVFTSENEAKKELGRRNLRARTDLLYLPPSLKAELQPDEDGQIVRVEREPRILPGDAMKVKPERRLSADPDPVLLRPDWYVSRDDRGGVWAWRSAGDGQVSFARIRDRDGQWKTARWSSASQCLQHLGALGQFGQEHPTLIVAPSLAIDPPRKVVQGPSI